MSALLLVAVDLQVVLLTESWLRTEECIRPRRTQDPTFRITQLNFIKCIPFLTIDLQSVKPDRVIE
jgi:hypothetical protein